MQKQISKGETQFETKVKKKKQIISHSLIKLL